MNNLTKMLIPFVALIFLVGFGLNYIWKNGYPTSAQMFQEHIEKSVQGKPAQEKHMQEQSVQEQTLQAPDIRQDFENLLNEFLTSITTQAREYKKQRKILFELSNPDNLRETAYIEENYAIAQELIPALHKKMDMLIKSFEIAEAQIHTLLKGQSEKTSIAIIKEWKALKTQQAGSYVEFFALESEILTLYEELMRFYYIKQNDYQVDMDLGKIVFYVKEDEIMRDNIHQKISSLSREQGLALTRSRMKMQ